MFNVQDINSTLLRTLLCAGLDVDVGAGSEPDVGTVMDVAPDPEFEVSTAPVCTGAGGTNRGFFAALPWRS